MEIFKNIISQIKFNEAGLVPAIAQQYNTGQVLMMAWMNAASIEETLKTNRVCYFSRSRSKLWRKGEDSAQVQHLKEMSFDCDADTILLKVDQIGVACHTGRRSCFFNSIKDGQVVINQEVVIAPKDLYKVED